MNANYSAAATIASEDEDYKHMEDVEEEPERLRSYVTEKQRRSVRQQKARKSAWSEQREEERLRFVLYLFCKCGFLVLRISAF